MHLYGIHGVSGYDILREHMFHVGGKSIHTSQAEDTMYHWESMYELDIREILKESQHSSLQYLKVFLRSSSGLASCCDVQVDHCRSFVLVGKPFGRPQYSGVIHGTGILLLGFALLLFETANALM